MKFKEVKVRVSTQVINIGQPERWNVAEVVVEIEDGETFEQVSDVALQEVNAFHEKHSKSTVVSNRSAAHEPVLYFNETTRKHEH